ncbi:MAG: putative capsular polysaccharide synthesis family protein, partial [Planctomycetota bacterium]
MNAVPNAEDRKIPERTGLPPNTFGTPAAEAVLIHQPGKVGSSSMYQSMLYSVPVPSFQTHAFNISQPYFRHESVYAETPDPSLPVHVRKAQHFYRYWYRKGRPYAVVTIVRNPIARNVSAFFQNIDDFPELADTDRPPPVERYQEVFLAEWDHTFVDRWFDFHFQEPFGLDWFAQSFDADRGHASTHDGQRTFLLMQLELPDDTKEQSVRTFLNFDGFSLDVMANVGDEKKYAEVYKAFRKLPLPQDYLDAMCESRVARHLYTPKQ